MISEKDFIVLESRLSNIEKSFEDLPNSFKAVVTSEIRSRFFTQAQSECQYGLYTALCVDTIDIWKQNKIRFFCPIYHDPKKPIKSLPWANPISSMGGFDDCGLNWIPPAGSTVCILFEGGSRTAPFYIGTTWHRNRGPEGEQNWGINIEEYANIHQGHRKGYLAGPNDESQVLPSWNTESYNGFDISSPVDFANDPEAQKRITVPNIYGFKTPQKHMMKMVDGDPNCNHKWKRMELMSSCGNWMMFKDDHLHYAGQWSHPDCGVEDGDVSCIEGQDEGLADEFDVTRFQGLSGSGNVEQVVNISPKQGTKKEKIDCTGKTSNSKIIGGHPSTPEGTKYAKSQKGANPYFKHQNECRPYKGPGTPQNNVCDLPQTGWQVMSLSGHTMVMDDSVEEPSGIPEWERSMESFDFGCNNKYLGRTYWKSATGHSITLSDIEAPEGDAGSQLRGENNGVFLKSANGNRIDLNDHTVQQKDCPGCPPNIGGSKRGITMESTSKHTFEMIDEDNAQCSPCRKEGGKPESKAKKAFIKIRTGYGLEMEFKDANSQEKTVEQSIQIFSPQKDNIERGPHIWRMTEKPSGPGLVFLRTGGDYVISTNDNSYEIVGDEEKSPSDKVEIVSRKKIVFSKDNYINITDKSQMFIAKDKIMLMAGQDCNENGGCPGTSPCIGPVLVYVGGCIRLSDRVYASSSMSSDQASIFMLSPLTECPPCQES